MARVGIRITKDMAIGSTQLTKATVPTVMFCAHCHQTVGKLYLPGEFVFGKQTGKCDCSWTCCEKVKPLIHDLHILWRPATETEIETIPSDWEAYHLSRKAFRTRPTDDSHIGEEIIAHIEKTTDPLSVVNLVIEALGVRYDENRSLITGLLYYKYDLQGM